LSSAKGAIRLKIGIGTTGFCNLKCPHCYSRKYDGKSINLSDINKILENINVESVNFGTGENILNPEFREILRLFNDRKIKMSLTTNGYTVSQLEDEYLAMFNDLDFSLEFPDKKRQDAFRGTGAWDMAKSGLSRCEALNIDTSIACTMMNSNAEFIPEFRSLMSEYDVTLRINVVKNINFQDREKGSYVLEYSTFWKTFERLFSEFELVTCSEPILCVALGHEYGIKGSPCGQHSMRIQPDGTVLPCVYWPIGAGNIRDKLFDPANIDDSAVFKDVAHIPSFCSNCDYVDLCRGGCAARRILSGDINTPDEYCPLRFGLEIPKLRANYSAKNYDLVHSTYLCTVIFGLGE
jgi:radical SAM protein with 4Fe4S-binding SPASM domain